MRVWFDQNLMAARRWAEGFLLAPEYLWLLWFIPIIILLYLLKLRRTSVLVPSNLLWYKSLQDLTANAPFQRLRKNLLLLLQLIILIALAAGAARPFFKTEGATGQSLCVLLDHSASMQTLEGDGARLDLAKEKALELVRDMDKGDKMMVVSFADKAGVLCELTDDRSRLRQAIANITPTDSATHIRDAILLAHSLKLTVQDLHVIVISDGRIADLEEITARAYDLSYLQVGASQNNLGLIAFSLRDPLEGQGGERQCFMLMHNASDQAITTTLSLYLDATVLAAEELTVPPGQDYELVYAMPEIEEGLLRAELSHDDDFPLDDMAWLAVRPDSKVRVLLVADASSNAAYVLQRVLLPDSRVELSLIAPDGFASSSDYDLTIFNNFAPETLPEGSLLFLNAVPPVPDIEDAGELAMPPILATDKEHPVMRFLNPANVSIAKARQINLPQGARSLVSTAGGPLIADVSRGGQQILMTTFDIAGSDWPLRLSFPLFFQNLISWIPRSALGTDVSVAAGAPIPILPEPEVDVATVTAPDGTATQVRLDPLRPVYYAGTDQLGPYDVTVGEDHTLFAVNLLSKNESMTGPADSLTIGRGEFAAEQGSVKQNQELWRWFILAALVVLTLEWWIYVRRAWL